MAAVLSMSRLLAVEPRCVINASDAIRMARLWDGVAAVYDTAIPFFTVLGRRLVDALDPLPGERVLDIATGRGACLFPAIDRVAPTGYVVGVDVSAEMVAETAADLAARGPAAAWVGLVVGDAQRLPFDAGGFDLVMCSQSVGQLPDVVTATSEFRRVLGEGGRLGIQRDLGTDERWGFLPEVYRAVVGPPPPTKPPIDVPAVLHQAGFVDVERREEKVAFEFPDERAWWDWVRTTGPGLRSIEPLPTEMQLAYRDAVYERMQALRTPGGFPITFTVELVLSRR